jgi:hypothetical protein
MKTNNRLFNMQPLYLFLLAGFLFFSACNNSDNETDSPITDEDAVEVIESAFTLGTQGLTDGILGAALIARLYSEKSGNNDYCGVPFDSTLTIGINQPAVTANYSTTVAWTVNCNNVQIPQTIDFQRTASGSYETDRSSASNQISSSWTIGNLIGGNNWTFAGTYSSSGNFTSKVRDQRQWNNTFELTLSDIQVSKDFYSIVSGTGTFSLLLSDGDGNSRTFEGGIEFLGNAKATLTINGESIDLDWG